MNTTSLSLEVEKSYKNHQIIPISKNSIFSKKKNERNTKTTVISLNQLLGVISSTLIPMVNSCIESKYI